MEEDHDKVTRATVTGLLDNLERDGLVDRLRRKDDKRRVDVFLTKKGQALMESMMPDHCARVASGLDGLTKAEKRQMIEYRHKIEDGAAKFSDSKTDGPK
ncbi:MarR family winged helix-turn-helix transcriptional regulator [Sphingopyxis sp.]|uniref:MarR family winged helix-turn-helix transcriptional regulator n=1 Tax=Sphingopyxis sp. TaxID=1908224 RepID=UPI0034578674